MKNVYMVQPSNTYTGYGFKAAYLPYATGLLVAYAFSNETIKQNYEFKRFVFTRENTDDVVAKMESPAVVGFSNYIWNTQYNLVLAEKIKKAYPDCTIIFGGHNIAASENSFLDKYSFIDFLIRGEGEEAYLELLLKLCEKSPDFSAVNNISYRKDGSVVHNPVVILEKTDYPSPYLTGIFDYIYEENPDMQLDAILETSRGCPRSCAYCDWGCNNSNVKLYPIERVLAEIDWLAAHKTKFIWGADANFGAYDRDLEIVDYFVKVRQETGYPERLRINYAMKNPDRVLEINGKLEKYGLSREGATLSFQTLNPVALENIGRNNMTLEQFSKLISLYKKEGITTYSELIAGLPGETYDSFCEGIGKLLAAGQHRLITTYMCQLLPNSPMASPEYIKKHGIKTVEIDHLTAHIKDDSEIREKTTYVIGSDSMSTEDWVAVNIFTCMQESYHHFGILKFIAIYLFEKTGIRYEKFYNDVIGIAKSDKNSVASSPYNLLYNYFHSITESKPIELYENELFGDIKWSPNLWTHLETIYKLDKFYDEIRPLILSYGVSPEIADELIRYQKTVIKQPAKNNYSEDFNYNWHEYFTCFLADRPIELVKKKNTLRIKNASNPENWVDYALEAVWFNKNGITFNPNVEIE